jgi:signal transduction histidine kinase
LVDDILQLLPQTRQVFMVTGAGPLSHFWRPPLEQQFSRFKGRLTFIWSNDLSLQEILRKCANLPPDSAILYLFLVQDSQGGTYADERVLAELHATANAPLFANHTVMLGHGVVGGRLVSIEDLSRRTAGAAVRLLNGEPPASVRLPLQLHGPPIFDWRELQRWNIPESRLPPDSVFVYRPPSLWEEHKRTVLGVAGALALQAILIVGLLYQRRARRRAEMESRRNLALAVDASRRQTVSALASSMAHDLGQPISAIIHNAQALDRMIAADRATPDTIVEILSDIRSQGAQAAQIIDRHRTMLKSRQLEKKPIDLHGVVSECLALVAHDMSARQIQATVNLSSNPCVVSGDPVLLQQVLVNLVMNAMDAMAETPPGERRVMISTDVRASDVEVAVRDTGTGLPAQMKGALFTPFATTKAHGLGIGLSIARTIVEAHDGSIEAHNNPEGGATFTVRLRLAQQPGAVIGGSVG